MDVDDSSLIAATETETSSIQISLTSSTTEDIISDRDILMGLRPIVLLQQLKVHGDSALLCTSLKTLDFLQLPSLIHSKPKEVILKELRQIYRAARSREAEKCATDGDVAMNIREAAIEIRNAILHAELKCIHQESEMKVYQGLVPDLQTPGEMTRVVIRPEDQKFWDRCIELSLLDHPVCGVGNPGIGITTTVLRFICCSNLS
jgi:hypothetical protein